MSGGRRFFEFPKTNVCETPALTNDLPPPPWISVPPLFPSLYTGRKWCTVCSCGGCPRAEGSLLFRTEESSFFFPRGKPYSSVGMFMMWICTVEIWCGDIRGDNRDGLPMRTCTAGFLRLLYSVIWQKKGEYSKTFLAPWNTSIHVPKILGCRSIDNRIPQCRTWCYCCLGKRV